MDGLGLLYGCNLMGYQWVNGRKYYHYFKRQGDVIINMYLGNSEEAELVASAIAQRKAEKLEHIAFQERLDQAEEPIIDFAHAAHQLYIAYKYSLGFHLHKRQWRKRGTTMHLLPSVEDEERFVRELVEYSKHEFEDEDTSLNKYYATPAIKTLNCMLESMNIDILQREAYKHQYARMQRKLLADRPPSTIESVMASRIALDYLDVNYHDQLYYANMCKYVKIADSLDKRRTRAARRLTRSIRAFADLTRTSINEVQKAVNTLKLKVVGGDES